jgi:hypothetical protein
MNIKHLLNGVAIAAALAIAGPVWAQNPSGGNGMGMPGPNPGGGGGLTPYSGGGTGAAAAPAPMPSPTQPGRMPQGGKKTSSRGGNLPPAASGSAMPPASTSAMPPAHHAVHHARAMHAFHKGMAHKAALTGDTTAQLNREELARLQAGAPPAPMPPPPPMANPSGGNSMGMQGPNAGGPGLTPYSGGAGGGGLGR